MLRRMWGVQTLRQIATELQRTPHAVELRAHSLKFPFGAPQGTEYVTTAAERCGFDVAKMRRILRWAGVRTVQVAGLLSVPQKKRTRGIRRSYRRQVVDAFDATSAVERFNRTELVLFAARRLGMCTATLATLLREAGKPPFRLTAKGDLRVDPDVADEVVRARRSLEGVTSASERVGVDVRTLTRWLRMSGLKRPGRNWNVDPAIVDRVVAERRAAISTQILVDCHASRERIIVWMKAHGVPRRGRRWMLTREHADAFMAEEDAKKAACLESVEDARRRLAITNYRLRCLMRAAFITAADLKPGVADALVARWRETLHADPSTRAA